jgi:hypothetical protein
MGGRLSASMGLMEAVIAMAEGSTTIVIDSKSQEMLSKAQEIQRDGVIMIDGEIVVFHGGKWITTKDREALYGGKHGWTKHCQDKEIENLQERIDEKEKTIGRLRKRIENIRKKQATAEKQA